MKKFAKDVASDAVRARVENDFEGGVRSGVDGTPAFFINGNRLNSYLPRTIHWRMLSAVWYNKPQV